MTATTISCVGDRRFRAKMKYLALRSNTDVAVMVRTAVDAMFGSELDEVDSLFDLDGAYMHHNAHESSKMDKGVNEHQAQP